MKKGAFTFLIAVVALFISGRPASALVIMDSDFFSDKTHIVITFETDGLGNKLKIAEGQELSMPADEYAYYGFTFEPGISWINDSSVATDEAQTIGGSPEIGIPGSNDDDFIINMSFPTRAFGFWVINNPIAENEPFPYLTLQAYGDDGLIEEVTFEGDAIDGVTGSNAEYGFLGIASEKFITSIHITKDATLLDNFTYSPIPEPATVLLLGLGFLALLRKRPA